MSAYSISSDYIALIVVITVGYGCIRGMQQQQRFELGNDAMQSSAFASGRSAKLKGFL
jgi:hypothetical protein